MGLPCLLQQERKEALDLLAMAGRIKLKPPRFNLTQRSTTGEVCVHATSNVWCLAHATPHLQIEDREALYMRLGFLGEV